MDRTGDRRTGEVSVYGRQGSEWAQSREGVESPDCLAEEPVPESPPRQQPAEEAVGRVGGVTCNFGGFTGETGVIMSRGGTPWTLYAALTM